MRTSRAGPELPARGPSPTIAWLGPVTNGRRDRPDLSCRSGADKRSSYYPCRGSLSAACTPREKGPCGKKPERYGLRRMNAQASSGALRAVADLEASASAEPGGGSGVMSGPVPSDSVGVKHERVLGWAGGCREMGLSTRVAWAWRGRVRNQWSGASRARSRRSQAAASNPERVWHVTVRVQPRAADAPAGREVVPGIRSSEALSSCRTRRRGDGQESHPRERRPCFLVNRLSTAPSGSSGCAAPQERIAASRRSTGSAASGRLSGMGPSSS